MSSDARVRLLRLSDEERRLLVERLLRTRRPEQERDILAQPRTTDRFPVSYAQQRIWFLQQLAPLTSAFNVPHALRLSGALDHTALQRSLTTVVQRHEALRTTFELVDSQPVQRIAAQMDLRIVTEDLRSLPEPERTSEALRRAREEARRPWDLARGPLVRATLWQLADDQHAFMLVLHHIICDGWSLSLIKRELIICYQAYAAGKEPSLGDLPIQYADYATWQRQRLETVGLEDQFAYWRRRMAGAVPLRLPIVDVDRGGQSSGGVARRVTLSNDLTQKLKALSQAEGVTPFMLLLAVFAMLLSRYGNQEDVVVGSPVANRNRPELENLVGCFMNPLPFRVDLTGSPSFRELLKRVRDAALEVHANQDVPFDLLVRSLQPKREAAYPPLYQAMFLFHNFPWEPPKDASTGVQAAVWPFLAGSAGGHDESELVGDQVFPVTLQLFESAEGITGSLEYTPQFADALSRAPEHLRNLVEAAVSAPDRSIRDLPMLSRRERDEILARRTSAPVDAPVVDDQVHRLFDLQAQRTPDALALIGGDERLTYRELAARVNRLAAYLQTGFVALDTPVGVLLDRSVDSVVAVLAILRSGGAYVPLDPAIPVERLAFMLDHLQVPVVLTRQDVIREQALDERILQGRSVIRLDADADAIAGQPESVPAAEAGAEHLAYLLYTSGSSGRPKAVAISRGSLANYACVARARFELHAGDRVLQFASLNFDTAAEEIFPTLISGATLVLRNDAMLASVPAFFSTCQRWGITVLDLPTAYWHELTVEISRRGVRAHDALRLVILGGEKALGARVREWQAAVGPRVRLLNTYGPTETTVVATMCDLPAAAGVAEDVPIGRPVSGAETFVVDRDLRVVPVGIVGELCIGGAGLARGYLNDPALTAERFVPHPWSDRPGARLYRTGDLARVRPDGDLDFAGRLDDQVKLRGQRVEPGEIEAALADHRLVREGCVLVREDHPGDPRLVAYVAPVEPSSLSIGELREFLQRRLPEYMVPSAFVLVGALPRTVQGKVDRDALPRVQWTTAADESYQAPQTDLEVKIASLWADVLHRDRVGLHDNFFDIGGHSLLVIRLHARLREELGEELSLVDLFQFPTVSSQAERLARPVAASLAPAAVHDRAARQRQAFRRLGK